MILMATKKAAISCLFLPSERRDVLFGSVFLAELIDTSSGINNLLCAGIERVAF